MEQFLSIGEVARRAGVSVQTLRHYDKLGLLTPSRVTDAGYRQYTESDYARLALIRTLRDMGFDLRTIAQLLQGRQEPAQAMHLQIEALESQRRALKRQQLILEAAVRDTAGEQAGVELARLHRKHLLAQLNKLEREAFLARHLGWNAGDEPMSQAVWQAAIFDLPEEMDEAQLEAWLELAEIAADPHFRQTLERQWEPLSNVSQAGLAEWQQLSQRIMNEAIEAVRAGHSLGDESAQQLVDEWIEGFAKLLARPPDAAFLRWMVRYFESTYDPRIARYWELISRIKGAPYKPMYVVHDGVNK